MRYLLHTLLLAGLLALALHGATQSGYGFQQQAGQFAGSGFLNFGAIDSGLHQVVASRQDELFFTAPSNRAFILTSVWVPNASSVDTIVSAQAVAGARLGFANLSDSSMGEVWEGPMLRLNPGDQLYINSPSGNTIGWSGFYVQP
jgi:hypothetical protein